MPLYSDDIAKIGPLTINDTAANIYLTMLINLGIVGTINYVVLLLCNATKFKKIKNIFEKFPGFVCFLYTIHIEGV